MASTPLATISLTTKTTEIIMGTGGLLAYSSAELTYLITLNRRGSIAFVALSQRGLKLNTTDKQEGLVRLKYRI